MERHLCRPPLGFRAAKCLYRTTSCSTGVIVDLRAWAQAKPPPQHRRCRKQMAIAIQGRGRRAAFRGFPLSISQLQRKWRRIVLIIQHEFGKPSGNLDESKPTIGDVGLVLGEPTAVGKHVVLIVILAPATSPSPISIRGHTFYVSRVDLCIDAECDTCCFVYCTTS